MREFRHLLVPTDFSEYSQAGFECALSLAQSLGAPLTVLHVVAPPPALAPVPGLAAGPVLIPERTREDLLSRLDRFAEPAVGAGVAVRRTLREGDPASLILEVAEEVGADLIVMGTHGRAGLERLILGSVTDRVLRRAPCPVVAVPPPSREQFDDGGLQRHTRPLHGGASG